MSMTKSARHPQTGATLIEVLVALFVLAIGLLGFLGMQVEGVTGGRKAYSNSQAAFLAEGMVERLRANRKSITSYNVNFGDTITTTTNCETAICSGTQMATWDKKQWLDEVASALPAGQGQVKITTGSPNQVVIQLKYRLDNDRSDTGVASDHTYTYTLKTEI